MELKSLALTGNETAAYAMKQIDPDVVAAYPITPSTAIPQAFSQYYADGVVNTEFVPVESEHSAMSACVGAAAAGARAMTATSANGLALMWEIIYIAASNRLPIILEIVNRALSAPINIHCDHSDTMGARDSGWIQIYSENNQEVYENTIMALRIAEHSDVLLPVMVCQDGFITSHSVEDIRVLPDDVVKKFIGIKKPHFPLLDTDNPVTYGPLDLQDYYYEHKRQQVLAMENARKAIPEIEKEFGKIIGKEYGFFEEYKTDDADVVLVAISSVCGTTKFVIDKLRSAGKKVGLIKLRIFRPFPFAELRKALSRFKVVGVLDRSLSFGAFPPVYSEIKAAVQGDKDAPKLVSYIHGLGGRDTTVAQLEKIYDRLFNILETGEIGDELNFSGIRE